MRASLHIVALLTACSGAAEPCTGQLVDVDGTTYCVHDLASEPDASCRGTDRRFPATESGILVCADEKLAGEQRDRVFAELRFLFDDCPDGFELSFGSGEGCVLPYPDGEASCADGASRHDAGAIVVCTAATVTDDQVVDTLSEHCAAKASSRETCEGVGICAYLAAVDFLTYADGACMPAQQSRCLLVLEDFGDDANSCAFRGDEGFWWHNTNPPHGYEASPGFDGAPVCDCLDP